MADCPLPQIWVGEGERDSLCKQMHMQIPTIPHAVGIYKKRRLMGTGWVRQRLCFTLIQPERKTSSSRLEKWNLTPYLPFYYVYTRPCVCDAACVFGSFLAGYCSITPENQLAFLTLTPSRQGQHVQTCYNCSLLMATEGLVPSL